MKESLKEGKKCSCSGKRKKKYPITGELGLGKEKFAKNPR